jgi:hypothetical protein
MDLLWSIYSLLESAPLKTSGQNFRDLPIQTTDTADYLEISLIHAFFRQVLYLDITRRFFSCSFCIRIRGVRGHFVCYKFGANDSNNRRFVRKCYFLD